MRIGQTGARVPPLRWNRISTSRF